MTACLNMTSGTFDCSCRPPVGLLVFYFAPRGGSHVASFERGIFFVSIDCFQSSEECSHLFIVTVVYLLEAMEDWWSSQQLALPANEWLTRCGRMPGDDEVRCFAASDVLEKPPEIHGSSHQVEVKRRAALVIDQPRLCGLPSGDGCRWRSPCGEREGEEKKVKGRLDRSWWLWGEGGVLRYAGGKSANRSEGKCRLNVSGDEANCSSSMKYAKLVSWAFLTEIYWIKESL